LNALSDLYLDSVGWSGGNTTLEAVHHGLPVVTTPGSTMRSRHSAAILSHIGLADHIAENEAAYIARAIRLIDDVEFRRAQRASTVEAGPRLWNDLSPVRALEAALVEHLERL